MPPFDVCTLSRAEEEPIRTPRNITPKQRCFTTPPTAQSKSRSKDPKEAYAKAAVCGIFDEAVRRARGIAEARGEELDLQPWKEAYLKVLSEMSPQPQPSYGPQYHMPVEPIELRMTRAIHLISQLRVHNVA